MSSSSTTSSWEITSGGGGDVSVIVDHHYDDDDHDDSNMIQNQNVALEQKMPDVDLLNHPYPHRYGGASSLLHPRHPPLGVLSSPGASTTSSSQHQQQYASYMRYQRTTPIAISEENLRKFGASSPWDISSAATAAKSSTSSALLTSWKLDQARLQDYHTVFRTPLHVPDSEYGAYLLGRNGRKETSIVTKQCCATACAGFSAVGVVFLLFIGILLDTQPLYIPGTLPELVVQSTFQYKNSDGDEVITYTKPVIQYLVPGPSDERLPIAATAYKAALAYFCTLVACLYVRDPTRFHWLTRWLARHVGRRIPGSSSSSSSSSAVFEYTDIPDDPASSNLPMLFADATTRSVAAASVSLYQPPGLWNRTTEGVQRWLAVRGWYRVRRRNKNKKKG
jgi:hypothetical protein